MTRDQAITHGHLKLWVTRPTEFRLPMKWGPKTCFYITHMDADLWEPPQ
jgi:hypothetical protein